MTSLLDPLRPLLRFVRHLPDRLLHPLRRRRALARLRERGAPETALFVCLGNINRSPYSAGAFEHALSLRGRDGVVVRSAGFIGPGRQAQDRTRELARQAGFDLESHVSRLVEAEEVGQTDLVVVMDPGQRRRLCRSTGRSRRDVVVLGDLDSEPLVRRGIQDPYGHPPEVFDRVYRRIDRCMDQLVGAVLSEPTSP